MAPRDFRKNPHSRPPKGGRSGPGKPGPAKGRPQKGGKPFHKPARSPGKPDAPRPQRAEHKARPVNPGNWLYGLHAVQAALANPRRKLGRLLLTRRAAEIIGEERPDHIRVEIVEPGALDRLLPPGAVHQGAALESGSLPAIDLDALLAAPHARHQEGRRRIVLVLDQLSDPHNVGAILRSAAAFGVTAVVVQDRHAPPQSGALAKAASGALDLVPYVEVVNIARTLEKLAEHGFWRIALERPREGSRPTDKAADGAQTLAQAIPPGDVALVLGSEGDGIRRLVREHCEAAAFIPIDGAVESLNVSNAAAIALYELRRG
jgi:23S rRNA (guanosine2251-2'-O)-methyltransferase